MSEAKSGSGGWLVSRPLIPHFASLNAGYLLEMIALI
jgi:hypothetical protein